MVTKEKNTILVLMELQFTGGDILSKYVYGPKIQLTICALKGDSNLLTKSIAGKLTWVYRKGLKWLR